MKKTLCLYFQVHQPYRLRQYRFFDIGKNHYYFDDFANKTIMSRVASRCYIPANKLMLDLIKKYDGAFKIAFSVSGIAMEQMEQYAPEALESFRQLADTGHVEFLAETYSHSLSSLISPRKFKDQISMHVKAVEKHFGQKPRAFRNTELIYSDTIGEMVAGLGFTTMLTEGARHILGWKSPDYLYVNALNPKLKLLLRNFRLSDDIAFRFSDRNWGDWPLTAEKYAAWIAGALEKDDIVNIFMDYESFGEHQTASSGIFNFLKALPGMILSHADLEVLTPSQATQKHQPIAPLNVPYAISWADEERDISAWLGNELQKEAFADLYKIENQVRDSNDPELQRDFRRLQASDHFYYMCTKFFSDGDVHKYFNPYDTPYEAFINYMNVLSDITLRATKKKV
ncbi:MAG: glycoside hydrolase family 57 protein [Bacteroidales bacterium]|jgi:alpha-amylase|nr:glycoside hydrolase family 57 protein [Bacteroidales bacterium]MDD3099916.1 glycoside hydrolase family 57 protein [Bacteroidales bacterium]MDD3638578.1 glycoside hydrolase family 57 protein [Bacteroidales bacterium]MDD3943295.1 glycoside hydrolase family 57 protein [Bacteroidales bacterium]MDD4480363.1 glycoside hydrolase family 57 protein [Bacteroidales bacterium]